MTLKRIGTIRSISKFEERFYVALVVVIAIVFVIGFATVALGWTLEDCEEVDFDHPDCDQYTTTTTEAPPSSTTSTSTPEGSTTSTTGVEQSTTTSTPTESTTTTPEPSNTPTTTTTIQECPPGTVHQPPMCVPTTVPFFETTTADTTPVIGPPAELPFTGVSDIGLLALAGVSLLFLGFTALKYGRSEE